MPSRLEVLERCRPVYEELPGWRQDITGVRTLDGLPANARRYIARIEALLSAPVGLIGVGPWREQLIEDRRSKIEDR